MNSLVEVNYVHLSTKWSKRVEENMQHQERYVEELWSNTIKAILIFR